MTVPLFVIAAVIGQRPAPAVNFDAAALVHGATKLGTNGHDCELNKRQTNVWEPRYLQALSDESGPWIEAAIARLPLQ